MAREEVIGSPRRKLVLQTTGDIRVKVGDKYYKLNYTEEDESSKKTTDSKPEESKFKIIDSISDYTVGNKAYPGEENILFAVNDNRIFYSKDEQYFPFEDTKSTKSSPTFNNTIVFEGNPAFKVKNNSLISNLNAEFLGGKRLDEIISEISDTNNTFIQIKTVDNGFSYSNKLTTISNLKANNAEINGLSVEKLLSNLDIKYKIVIKSSSECMDSIINRNGINLLNSLYDLYISTGIKDINNLDVDFITLCKNLLQVNNSDYNFDIPTLTEEQTSIYIDQLGNSELICSPKDLIFWKDYTTNNKSLYNWLIDVYYIGDLSSYAGTVFRLKCEGSFPIGTTFNLTATKEDNTNEEKVAVNCIVSGIDNDFVYITTDLQSNAVIPELQSSVTRDNVKLEITDGSTILDTILYTSYGIVETGEINYNEIPNYKLESTSVEIINGTIGSLSNYTDNIFKLEGIGIYSKSNSTFINPKIALTKEDNTPYIKIYPNGESYLGITSENNSIINISNNGDVKIRLSDCQLIITDNSGTEKIGKLSLDGSGALIFTEIE